MSKRKIKLNYIYRKGNHENTIEKQTDLFCCCCWDIKDKFSRTEYWKFWFVVRGGLSSSVLSWAWAFGLQTQCCCCWSWSTSACCWLPTMRIWLQLHVGIQENDSKCHFLFRWYVWRIPVIASAIWQKLNCLHKFKYPFSQKGCINCEKMNTHATERELFLNDMKISCGDVKLLGKCWKIAGKCKQNY